MENKTENHMTSVAAFVEGGIQESCNDACSICLEEFCNSDPSTVTACRHEFHLQCILEWCQRSSQCPMCWQPISLKDPTSRELFEAVEQERKWRILPSRNAAIFHHPVVRDFGLQHLRLSVNDADFEERIIQQLTAVATIGRAQHFDQREWQRIQPPTHGQPHFLTFSNQNVASASSPDSAVRWENDPNAIPRGNLSPTITSDRDEPLHQTPQLETESSSSEFHSFFDTLRSRLNLASTRYKDSISKGAMGWKDIFSRSSFMSEHSSNTRKKGLNHGIASVSQSKQLVEVVEDSRNVDTSLPNHLKNSSFAETSNHDRVESSGDGSSL